ncbi:hypothetical protein PENSPDRAFT_17032 [Peniophora sp. CONT]|nr:hypothetical protein PENSPDRAFT_17032 [Peniophora sp. CONT]
MYCVNVRRVAGKTFFDLQASNGVITTSGELVAGQAPAKSEAMRCTRRSGTYFAVRLEYDAPTPTPTPSRLGQVLALCTSLGYVDGRSAD